MMTTRVLDGFDDPAISAGLWGRLLPTGDTDVVCTTWQWQRTWWETRGRGDLLLIAVERDGEVVALAPLHADAGMIYFVGCRGSGYLDFVGDVGDPATLDAILETAIAHTPDFAGVRLNFVPAESRTGPRLEDAAARLGLSCYHETDGRVPVIDLAGQTGQAAADKKSLRRHENFFRREGGLEVRHFSDGRDILAQFDEFVAQNVARFAVTPVPSKFLKPSYRQFVERMTALAADTGWLRFTRLDWQGRAIAFHLGFCYRSVYYWFEPCFAIDLARRSPGEALIRQLLLAAIGEGATTFDLGGDPIDYKMRFATRFNKTRTWELYPRKTPQ
jgi:CelD/BcsL family acetyltransferase involved in cellulose biosynthesis